MRKRPKVASDDAVADGAAADASSIGRILDDPKYNVVGKLDMLHKHKIDMYLNARLLAKAGVPCKYGDGDDVFVWFDAGSVPYHAEVVHMVEAALHMLARTTPNSHTFGSYTITRVHELFSPNARKTWFRLVGPVLPALPLLVAEMVCAGADEYNLCIAMQEDD